MSRQAQQSLSGQHQDKPRTPSALEIIEVFFMAAHLLHRLAERGVGSALSGPRTRVLMEVSKAEQPLRMKDVAAELGITARTITTLIDALEGEGLLVRQPDPADRRATLLMLTDTGRKQVEELETLAQRISESLLAPLEAAQRQQLNNILQQIISHAQAQL